MKEVRTFTEFNNSNGETCPICGTSEAGEIVLIPVNDTIKDNLAVAVQVHLQCLVSNSVFHTSGVIVTRCSFPEGVKLK